MKLVYHNLLLLLAILLMSAGACTSSRWIVTDENAIDPNDEPVVVDERVVLLLESEPTYDSPQIIFQPYILTDRQYKEWIRMERTVQQYRPRWGFMLTGLAASAYIAAASNSSRIKPVVTDDQQTVMNISAGLLSAISVLNLKPTGEPIYTGESQLMQQSGTVILTDTTHTIERLFSNDFSVDLEIFYDEELIFSESNLEMTNGRLELNLSFVSDYVGSDLDEDDSISVQLSYNDTELVQSIGLNSFLQPHVSIISPIAVLRNTRLVSDQNVVTEVGQGSSLRLIDQDDEWYSVQFGGSEVYVSVNSGEIEWRSSDRSGSAAITEFADVPFGGIDVENSVPILKENNPQDRAIILTNGFTGEIEPRQYLDRDHELFRFYMRSALQMNRDQIITIEMDSLDTWKTELEEFAEVDSVSSLHIYLSGIGYLTDHQNIGLMYVDQESEVNTLSDYLFGIFEQMNPNSLFLYVDLDFLQGSGYQTWINGRSSSTLVLVQTANELLRRIPNAAIIFSNRPGQKSSVYASSGLENRRHHIFNYYLADAIKRRNVRIADIVRHLENNVDYTSRRYHDRPQEIIVFGNTTLNINQ